MIDGVPLPAFQPGSVWLVGAGPGDPALLTLAALSALKTADVIVYDALVDERVLALASPAAAQEKAGKRGGRPSPKQADITERLIALARDGKRVLRLKGGDPFIFGRGGEEALGLTAAGIPFRVVPGVTAGLAALTAAGIPATTRDYNQAVLLATGHGADGLAPDLDWAAAARLGQPLVLYMAIRSLETIVASLRAGGMDETTPVAVIAEATTERQRVLVSTLATAVADIAAAGIEPPAIVVIGRNVQLRAAFGIA